MPTASFGLDLEGGSLGGSTLGAILSLGVEMAERAGRKRCLRKRLFLGIQNAQAGAHHFAGVVVAPARNQARSQFFRMLRPAVLKSSRGSDW